VEETWAASGYEDLAERNPLRYRAYYYDTATDLYYLPARYYDPDTMRFLSPDPASPSAGDPLTLNRYAYCVGDPVNHSDPSGARHEAGGGSSRVAQEAIDLAREGRLDEAKAVQGAYQQAVSSAYAAGGGYEDAHKAGASAAQERLGWLIRLSPVPTVPDDLDRAANSIGAIGECMQILGGPLAMVGGASSLTPAAFASAPMAAQAGLLLYGSGRGIEVIGDVYGMGRTVWYWVQGKRSIGDLTVQAFDLAWTAPGGSIARVFITDPLATDYGLTVPN
jgi:RHS repeat-associated protein